MARPANNNKKVRLNLEVPPALKDRIEHLRDVSGADSMTEVVRRALAYYEYLLIHSANGREVVIKQPDGQEQTLVIT